MSIMKKVMNLTQEQVDALRQARFIAVQTFESGTHVLVVSDSIFEAASDEVNAKHGTSTLTESTTFAQI